MKEIEVNKAKSLTIPASVNGLEINYEWGDTVASATGLVSGETYSFTPDSIGVYNVVWKNGTNVVSTDYYSGYMPLADAISFFSLFPELEDGEDKFPTYERRVRGIIQMFTGQRFGPIVNKTFKIQGDGGAFLELPIRITALREFTDNYGEDLMDYISIAPGEPFFLQYKDRFRAPFYHDYKRDFSYERMTNNFFTNRLDFSILGDFGWPYVPADVSEAAILLLQDEFNEANDLRRHGINEAQLGDFSYKLNADQWGTTGNTQADLLLGAYVIVRIGLV